VQMNMFSAYISHKTMVHLLIKSFNRHLYIYIRTAYIKLRDLP